MYARWSSVLALVLGLAALISLAVFVAWWAALVALLLARLVTGPGLGLRPVRGGRLSVQGWSGRWVFHDNTSRRELHLRHVWHGPVWTTLAFAEQAVRKPLYLTVWKSQVSPAEWRRLRQLAARNPNKPRLRVTEGA